MPERRAKGLTGPVQSWHAYLARTAKAEGMRPARDDLARLSGLLVLVGDHPRNAQQAFWAFKSLFFVPTRLPKWPAAIAAIPGQAEGVQRITDCVIAYNEIIGSDKGRTFATAHFNLDNVVEAMVDIAHPRIYVEHMRRDNQAAVALIFHKNTLKEATKSLKGLLGPLSAGNYRESLTEVREFEF